MLGEEVLEQSLDTFSSDLARINSAGNHLLHLIDEVLDLSKIEAGKYELELSAFDVVELIHDVAQTMEPLIEKNGNVLRIEMGDGLVSVRGLYVSDESVIRRPLLKS